MPCGVSSESSDDLLHMFSNHSSSCITGCSAHVYFKAVQRATISSLRDRCAGAHRSQSFCRSKISFSSSEYRKCARLNDLQTRDYSKMSTDSPDVLDKAIKNQGDFVRQLKADKAEKSKINEEIQRLLYLKHKLKVLQENGTETLNSRSTENAVGDHTNNDAVSDKHALILKTPKGTRDHNPAEMAVRTRVINTITDIFRMHGAVTIETPVFELKETLTNKYGEDSKLIYDLMDQGGELVSLRYDLTVPFARYLAMNKILTMKRYQIAKVYRRDQPSIMRGRYREFYQCDFDIAGSYDSMLPDAEILRILVEILLRLDFGKFEIKLNHRKLLDSVLTVCGVTPDKHRTVCSSIDKLDKTFWEDVKQEMIETKGLPEDVANQIGDYVKLHGGQDLIDRLRRDEKLMQLESAREALDEMELLLHYCDLYQVLPHVSLDLSLARGLDYYTGLIYEALLAEKTPGAESIGSIAAGGRYDNLVGSFDPKGRQVPCVGISIGIERVFAIMEARAKLHAERVVATEVMVVSAQKNLHEDRMKLCALLWNANIKAEMSNKKSPKLLSQLQYCEENSVPYAVVIGESELKQGVVTVRKVATRVEEVVKRDALVEHLKHLLQPPSADNSTSTAESLVENLGNR